MKVIELNGHIIELYSSIKELPIRLSKELQKYVLQDIGIGSEIKDIDDHLEKIFTFITHDQKSEALEEAKNLRLNIFSVVRDLDFKGRALACLVKSIDGVRVDDHSSEGLGKVLSALDDCGLTVGKAEEVVDEVKKNLIPNVSDFFHSSLAKI